jgi:hypothetical protein
MILAGRGASAAQGAPSIAPDAERLSWPSERGRSGIDESSGTVAADTHGQTQAIVWAGARTSLVNCA